MTSLLNPTTEEICGTTDNPGSSAITQDKNINQFVALVTDLFKAQPTELTQDPRFNAAKQALREMIRSSLDYKTSVDERGRRMASPTDDAMAIQLLCLANMVGHLRKNPTLFSEINRNELSQKFARFRDEKFVPHCQEKFAGLDLRYVENFLSNLNDVTERGLDFPLTTFIQHSEAIANTPPTAPTTPRAPSPQLVRQVPRVMEGVGEEKDNEVDIEAGIAIQQKPTTTPGNINTSRIIPINDNSSTR